MTNKNCEEKEKWVSIIKAFGDLIAKMPKFMQYSIAFSFPFFFIIMAFGTATAIYFLLKTLF